MICSIGSATANLTSYQGYDHSKTIGVAGLQNWSIGQKGVCVSAYTHIKGKLHHVYVGTPNTGLMNKVKYLIVNYYSSNMGRQAGYNLQYVVWHFSDKIKSPNAVVSGMIAKANHNTKKIPDIYSKLLSSTSTSTTTSTSSIAQTGTTTNSNSTILLLGNTTTSQKQCCQTITTIVYHYQNITTTNTINTYTNTTTYTTITKTVKKYQVWKFNTIRDKKSQKIVLFNVHIKTVNSQNTSQTSSQNSYNTQTSSTGSKNYDITKTITTKTPCTPCKPPVKPPCKPKVPCKCKC